MSKLNLLVLFVLVNTIAFAQDRQKVWKKKDPLVWSDFQGPIDTSIHFFALTRSGDHTDYHWKEKNGVYTFTFDVNGVMKIDKSWTRVEKQTPELLKHEQTHFDISEFFARQIRITFNRSTFTKNYKDEIAVIQQKDDKDREAMQLIYDTQTNHSRNKEMQAKWEAYVADLLDNNYTLEEALKKAPVAN